MFKEIIWLFVIVGIAASQQEENANEKTQEENPIDVSCFYVDSQL